MIGMGHGINTDGHFAPEAQQTFQLGDRVYDVQSQREGWYFGRKDGWGDVAFVGLDGDKEPTEMSFVNLRQLYR